MESVRNGKDKKHVYDKDAHSLNTRFMIVMTTMFEDIKTHTRIQHNALKNIMPEADSDERMFADDTIIISEDTRTMNEFIKQIETNRKKHWTTPQQK